VEQRLHELEELGVIVSIDDFGTGHASVKGLMKIKPSILKIDRHFIQPIVENESARALALSIIGIGKSLDMRIVAEGVETEKHAQIASEMGCDFLQGFHFGQPMCAADLRDKLMENNGLFYCTRNPESRNALRVV
jgi:EAL domain-containing protein (putative c-di-GMP-specific phosphodiesterase class I)